MIPDHIKEQVKEAADIVEIVSDHVKLKRSGSNFMGLCPFHSEKSPSFNVSPHLGIYKCFGCGESGDVFSFVMKLEGLSFTEAIRQLGSRYGIDVPEDKAPEQDEHYRLKEGIYHALKFAGKFFHDQLVKTSEGQSALAYLENRGLLRSTIRSYGLGYSPDSFDSLLREASHQQVKEEYLYEAGLIKYGRNGESAFDVFRNRLMFPIFNASGRIIGFGGRVLADSKGNTPKNTPKYINTSQTKVYNKSEVLYGIHAARNEIRKHGEVILVEGYTDVLSLHQSDIRNVVATSGTALTKEQLLILHRYTENLLMIYDADLAGQNAMSRGLDLALREGLNVRLLQLPSGEDPDSFIQKQKKQGFISYKDEHSFDFVTFLIQKAQQENHWNDPIHKKETISHILRSIAHIPDAITRETFIQRLSELANLGTRGLFEELNVQLNSLRQNEDRQKKSELRMKSASPFGSTAQKAKDEQVRSQNKHSTTNKGSSGQNVGYQSSKSGHDERSKTSFNDSEIPEYLRIPDENLLEHGTTDSNTPPPWHDESEIDSLQPYSIIRGGRSVSDVENVTLTRRPPYERELLRLMLQHMHPMVEYVGSQCNEDHFEDPEYRKFFADLIYRYMEGLPISVSVYMEREEPFPALTGEIVFDRYETSSRTKEKIGKKIHRDGNPYKTAKGELRTLKIYYLDRIKQQLQDQYIRATDAEEKSGIQELLIEVSRERVRYQSAPLDELFPNPEDV